jgi:hypothetical protein
MGLLFFVAAGAVALCVHVDSRSVVSLAKPDSLQWWQYATKPLSVRLMYSLRFVSSPEEHPV